MKKIIFAVALMFVFSGLAFAEEVTPVYANGSPETVVNAWGTTNAELPHIKQGQTMTLMNGESFTCPAWFPMYCVDITGTSWFKARYSR